MKRIAVLLVILALLVSAVPARAESICAPGEIEVGGMCVRGPTTCARGESETANGCIARPPVCCIAMANRRLQNRIIHRPIGRQLVSTARFAWKH
jgi:hypothetical protein